jgi:hypothetical protein
VDHLPGFSVCHIGYRTGVDDANIRLFIFPGFPAATVKQALQHGVGFILIHLAAQCVDKNLFIGNICVHFLKTPIFIIDFSRDNFYYNSIVKE